MEQVKYVIVLNGNDHGSAEFDYFGDACAFVINNDLSCCHIVKQVVTVVKEEVLSF